MSNGRLILKGGRWEGAIVLDPDRVPFAFGATTEKAWNVARQREGMSIPGLQKSGFTAIEVTITEKGSNNGAQG